MYREECIQKNVASYFLLYIRNVAFFHVDVFSICLTSVNKDSNSNAPGAAFTHQPCHALFIPIFPT